MGGCIRSQSKKADEQEPKKTNVDDQEPTKTLLTDKPEGKPAEASEAEAALRKLFADIDADDSGTISVAELLVALRRDDFDFAALLEAADMNSRSYVMDRLEAYQESRISWDGFGSALRSALDIGVGDMALVLSTRSKGVVVNRTTTDVELEMPDGSKISRGIDEIRMASTREEPRVSQEAPLGDAEVPGETLGDGEVQDKPPADAEPTEVEVEQPPLRFKCCS